MPFLDSLFLLTAYLAPAAGLFALLAWIADNLGD